MTTESPSSSSAPDRLTLIIDSDDTELEKTSRGVYVPVGTEALRGATEQVPTEGLETFEAVSLMEDPDD